MMIYCADIGSVANGNFGWAGRSCEPDRQGSSGTDIAEFARVVADRLAVEEKVALGFECPLWIPVADEPSRLTRARPGEGDRPWSAAAGSTSLTTGLSRLRGSWTGFVDSRRTPKPSWTGEPSNVRKAASSFGKHS